MLVNNMREFFFQKQYFGQLVVLAELFLTEEGDFFQITKKGQSFLTGLNKAHFTTPVAFMTEAACVKKLLDGSLPNLSAV